MAQARIQRFARGKTYNLSEIFAANEASKEPYLTALIELVGRLEHNAKAYYAGMGWDNQRETQRCVTFGDKWDKVFVLLDGEKKARIICHIDSNTGLIYKSNTPQGAPYPKPRADIYDEESFKYADPHGGWLYANFAADKPRYGDSSVKSVIEKGEAIMSGQ